MFKILICGVGNIGRRYVEGLVQLNGIDIDILEYSDSNYEFAISQVQNFTGVRRIEFSGLKHNYDLVIIATPATGRAKLVSQINKLSKVRFWILEKLLAQSLNDISILKALNLKNSWVNTTRRITSAYKKINELVSGKVKEVYVNYPGLDMACNAIHYIDVCSWLTSSRVNKIQVYETSDWYPAKRSGYFMFDGVIDVNFENGSNLIISNIVENFLPGIKFITEEKTLHFDETTGALKNESVIVKIELEKQSEITPLIINDLMILNNCKLPSLDESIEQHIKFLNGLTCNKRLKRDNGIFPIT